MVIISQLFSFKCQLTFSEIANGIAIMVTLWHYFVWLLDIKWLQKVHRLTGWWWTEWFWECISDIQVQGLLLFWWWHQIIQQFVLTPAKGEESPGFLVAGMILDKDDNLVTPCTPHSCSVDKPLNSSQLLKGIMVSSWPYLQLKMLHILWISCRFLPLDL